MTEREAEDLARLLHGDSWQSGGGIWVVIRRCADGRIIMLTKEAVSEYADEETFQGGEAIRAIILE